MKKRIFAFWVISIIIPGSIVAQQYERHSIESGINFIETRVYSEADDARVLELYKNLRVADVSDGLDMVGLPGTGLVNPEIHSDWVDLKDFRHVFRGIAITVRYVPTQQRSLPDNLEDFPAWESNFYSTISTEAFTQIIRPGTAIVIDDVEDSDIGSV
jgi:4-hydroxy-4-methyl-2-oxoglutarate aldolase